MTIKKAIDSPVSWVIGVFATFTALEPTTVIQLATATYMNLGQLFSLATISALTLPQFWPPNNALDFVLFGIGLAFAAKIAHGIWKTYDTQL